MHLAEHPQQQSDHGARGEGTQRDGHALLFSGVCHATSILIRPRVCWKWPERDGGRVARPQLGVVSWAAYVRTLLIAVKSSGPRSWTWLIQTTTVPVDGIT